MLQPEYTSRCCHCGSFHSGWKYSPPHALPQWMKSSSSPSTEKELPAEREGAGTAAVFFFNVIIFCWLTLKEWRRPVGRVWGVNGGVTHQAINSEALRAVMQQRWEGGWEWGSSGVSRLLSLLGFESGRSLRTSEREREREIKTERKSWVSAPSNSLWPKKLNKTEIVNPSGHCQWHLSKTCRGQYS